MTLAAVSRDSTSPLPCSAERIPSWTETLLGFVYPQCCQVCGIERAGARAGYLCHRCRQGVRFVVAPYCQRCGLPFDGAVGHDFECANCLDRQLSFESARAAVVAEGVTLEVIHRYKYQRALWFEPFLAELLVQTAGPILAVESADLLVPVPLHPVRLREREFNQAERLARCLSRVTRIPVNSSLVERVEPTRTQTRLSREERTENVNRAFRARRGARLVGERCIVIDDVLTTGATTNAVARVLRAMGAGPVRVWSVARATFKPTLIGT